MAFEAYSLLSSFPVQSGWSYDDAKAQMCTTGANVRANLISSFSVSGHESWTFEIDVLTSPGGNSGVFYLEGQEFQVVSESHPNQLSSTQSFGAEYGDVAPVTYPAYPGRADGEWNRLQIRKVSNKIYHFLNGQYLLSYLHKGRAPSSGGHRVRLQHHGEVGMCYRNPSFQRLENDLRTCLWDQETYSSFEVGNPLRYVDILKSFYYHLGYLSSNEYTRRIDACADYDADGVLTYSDLVKVNYAYLGYLKPHISLGEDAYAPLPSCTLDSADSADLLLEGTDWAYDASFFSIRDGVVTGRGSPERNTFFVYRDGNITDFQLSIEVWVAPGSNSGIQYRSVDRGGFKVCGYQYEATIDGIDGWGEDWGSGAMYDGCGELGGRGQMGNLGKRTVWSGSGARMETRLPFYGDHRAGNSWKHVTIQAIGNRHHHYLDDRLVSVVHDYHPRARTSGYIGLQLHSGTSQEVEFRNARLLRCATT